MQKWVGATTKNTFIYFDILLRDYLYTIYLSRLKI